MSGNLDNDRSVTAGKMYPIDLAPQKITIVKSVTNSEVKMAHLITGQPKTTAAGQIITHTGPVGLMRPAAQILSSGVSSQPQMIVSGSPILQGAQIVTQGSQLISQGTQIISQPQLIAHSHGGQILSPGTQIISQGTQLSAQMSSANTGSSNVQVSVPSSVSGAQVLSVGGLVSGNQGQLVSGATNLVVSSSVRTLPPSVRVLPPLPHHNRPVLSTVNVSTAGVLVSKGVTSHVPRGLAAGASLAVRPAAPIVTPASQNWLGGASRGRALVYGTRAAATRAAAPGPAQTPAPAPAPSAVASTPTPPPHSAVITLPTTTVLTSTGVISGSVRGSAPRPGTPTSLTTLGPRPLPLLQRNYQPAKVVGVASVGVRGVVGNSAPPQLYYEVPRPQPAQQLAQPAQQLAQPALSVQPTHQQTQPVQALHHNTVNIVNTPVQPVNEVRSTSTPVSAPTTTVLPRPTILRKRDMNESPTKSCGVNTVTPAPGAPGWEDVVLRQDRQDTAGADADGSNTGSGGSTTVSAASSPAPDEEPVPEIAVSPRKKPRKQTLNNDVRQSQEFQAEEAPPSPPSPPPVTILPPPKRPTLSSSYVCGWRGTALHFVRPSDVRRREPRAADILALASQRHALAAAAGWKVHHLTAQMDDLVSLEADVGSQLAALLRTLETSGGRALSALQPHSHTLLELLKGNMQRSKIVCEGIQEAREDILRVFTHRNFVSDILTRQADKRCFRKHRSQS